MAGRPFRLRGGHDLLCPFRQVAQWAGEVSWITIGVEDFAGASAGGSDGVSAEFSDIQLPGLLVPNMDQPGFSLGDLPRVIGPFGVENLITTFTNYGNPYWMDMELVLDIVDVIQPGDLTVEVGGSEFGPVLVTIDAPGTVVLPQGYVLGSYINFNSTTGKTSKERQQLASFELDSWALRVTQAGALAVEPEMMDRGARLEISFRNPYPADSAIRFAVQKQGNVKLSVYDVTGRLVATLADGPRGAGEFMVRWDGRNSAGQTLASGVYFLKLSSGKESVTTKMLVLE